MHIAEELNRDLQDLPPDGVGLLPPAQPVEAGGDPVAVGNVFAAVPDSRAEVFGQGQRLGKAVQRGGVVALLHPGDAPLVMREHILIGDGVLSALAGVKSWTASVLRAALGLPGLIVGLGQLDKEVVPGDERRVCLHQLQLFLRGTAELIHQDHRLIQQLGTGAQREGAQHQLQRLLALSLMAEPRDGETAAGGGIFRLAADSFLKEGGSLLIMPLVVEQAAQQEPLPHRAAGVCEPQCLRLQRADGVTLPSGADSAAASAASGERPAFSEK